MIVWFDKAVIGMSVGETKTVNIIPREGYWEATIVISGSLPSKSDGTEYKVGESIITMNGPTIIESINDKEFAIKNNHQLAAKDLIFDITIKSIK